ncbi:MAG: hypothetical protein H7Y86_03135 [Rhizobacter sp.]|nr:hypothetical protein [Ferruginibacter sp.]
MEISSKQILNVLRVLAWILFLGLSVEAGAIIVSAVLRFIVNPDQVDKLWQEVNLTALFNFDRGHFVAQIILISIVAVMKALMFYLIVKIFYNKKLNLAQPFSIELQHFILIMALLSFGIGLFAGWATKYSRWLSGKGVAMPDIQLQTVGGADVWIFMSVVLYVLSQIFKRGIEIQSENELTV